MDAAYLTSTLYPVQVKKPGQECHLARYRANDFAQVSSVSLLKIRQSQQSCGKLPLVWVAASVQNRTITSQLLGSAPRATPTSHSAGVNCIFCWRRVRTKVHELEVLWKQADWQKPCGSKSYNVVKFPLSSASPSRGSRLEKHPAETYQKCGLFWTSPCYSAPSFYTVNAFR